MRKAGRAALAIAGAVCALGASLGAGETPSERAKALPVCECELRSWLVAGRGRHLFLDIDCPSEWDGLNGVVEFTTALVRTDYVAARDESELPRVARMSRGEVLGPAFGVPDNRFEARYEVSIETARELQRDRLWDAPYYLLFTNSNSGMARALEDAGLELPAQVRLGKGLTGEFPGIGRALGEEIPAEEWGRFGLPGGPRSADIPSQGKRKR